MTTKMYYKIDGRNGVKILNVKPKNEEEVNKLRLEEREKWTMIAGCKDKELIVYRKHFGSTKDSKNES